MALLRRHNSIIRDALAAHSGREVKHTGDGMMASFLSVGKAIDCSCAIQREFTAHNEAATEPMRVRIGISAGEPVTEGEDLFGAAVQLARRICDHAEPGRIFVTSVVRDLCLGKKVHFEDRGEAVLRGFEEPVRVFEVAWKGAE
jgi:adenylate cyclase